MSAFKTVNPANLSWSPRVMGCFKKLLFEYSSQTLGEDGVAGSYTTMYRFDPGARYPVWRVVEGAVEIAVLQGTLVVNGISVPAGDWVQLRESEAGWTIGSDDGCEVLAIVRGHIERVRST